jgi:hypothetical protein
MPAGNQQGTGFINLQNYLNANQGNNLGSTVAGGITNQANQAQTGLTNSQQSFNQGIQGAQQNLTGEQNTAQNLFGTTDASGNTTGGIYNTNPSAIASAPTTDANGTASNPYQAQWQGIENYQYGGPTQLSNLAGTQAKAQNAAQLGNETKSQGGQTELLQQFAAAPGQQYTQGQQNLDTMLLGQQGSGQLKQAAQKTAGLPQQVNNAEAAAESQAQGQQQQAQQFVQGQNQNFQNIQAQLLGGNVNGQSVAGAIPTAQQNAQSQISTQNTAEAAAQQALASGDLAGASAALAQAGYSPDQINQLTQLASIGIWNYNNTGDLAAVANALQAGTAGTGISAQQAAQANALAQLGGTALPNYAATQNVGPGIQSNANVGVLGGDLTKDIGGTTAAINQANQQIDTLFRNPNAVGGTNAQYNAIINSTDPTQRAALINQYLNNGNFATEAPGGETSQTFVTNLNNAINQQQAYEGTLAQQQAAQNALNQFIEQYQ